MGLILFHERAWQSSDSSWRRTDTGWDRARSFWETAPAFGAVAGRHCLSWKEHNLLLPARDFDSAERAADTRSLCHWEMAEISDRYAVCIRFFPVLG